MVGCLLVTFCVNWRPSPSFELTSPIGAHQSLALLRSTLHNVSLIEHLKSTQAVLQVGRRRSKCPTSKDIWRFRKFIASSRYGYHRERCPFFFAWFSTTSQANNSLQNWCTLHFCVFWFRKNSSQNWCIKKFPDSPPSEDGAHSPRAWHCSRQWCAQASLPRGQSRMKILAKITGSTVRCGECFICKKRFWNTPCFFENGNSSDHAVSTANRAYINGGNSIAIFDCRSVPKIWTVQSFLNKDIENV